MQNKKRGMHLWAKRFAPRAYNYHFLLKEGDQPVRVLRFIFGLAAIILIAVLLGMAILFVNSDTPQRGLIDRQVFWLRDALLIFLPEGLILYLIFRPALKTGQDARKYLERMW
jgi:hypothetical protein